MGEWLIPTDCKSVAWKGYVGSNPTPSTRGVVFLFILVFSCLISILTEYARIAQSVERVLGKNEVTSSNLVVGFGNLRRSKVVQAEI